jgi:hypothetical protein
LLAIRISPLPRYFRLPARLQVTSTIFSKKEGWGAELTWEVGLQLVASGLTTGFTDSALEKRQADISVLGDQVQVQVGRWRAGMLANQVLGPADRQDEKPTGFKLFTRPGFGIGLAYMVPREPYEQYVFSMGNSDDVSDSTSILGNLPQW